MFVNKEIEWQGIKKSIQVKLLKYKEFRELLDIWKNLQEKGEENLLDAIFQYKDLLSKYIQGVDFENDPQIFILLSLYALMKVNGGGVEDFGNVLK